MTTSGVERSAEAFATELARWRVERGMSKKQLAGLMGFDPSYVSHVEGRRHRPTEDFARRADMVLGADGAIWQRFQDFDEARHGRTLTTLVARDAQVPQQWLPPGTGLVVEQEEAALAYLDGAYMTTVRRSLYNAGREPVSRYLIRVAVDRYPGDPSRSNQHHRDHPLTIAELHISATCGDAGVAEAMRWRVKQDRDAFKEVWLLFENEDGRYPLYPGERTMITYSYRVGAEKWGNWFQRAVRLPTRRMAVRIDLPSALDPQVWGIETSMSAEEAPLRTPIERETEGDRSVFTWTTDNPTLNARFRLQWRFRAVPSAPPAIAGHATASPGTRMAAIGVRQWHLPHPGLDDPPLTAGVARQDRPGASELRGISRRLELPTEEVLARATVGRLQEALSHISKLHDFGKGLGLAAIQLGVDAAIAVVLPPGGEPFVLLNPRIIGVSPDMDEQMEGCLSFFDLRGLVPRPLRIDVEHQRFDGGRVVSTFERGLARLVEHEVDHLDGRLYLDRMPQQSELIPLDRYHASGQPWRY